MACLAVRGTNLHRLRKAADSGEARFCDSVRLARLQVLRTEEATTAEQLTECRQRINELRRLLESSEAYSGSIRVQRDRLALADWLRGLEQDVQDPLVALADGDRQQLACTGRSKSPLEAD